MDKQVFYLFDNTFRVTIERPYIFWPALIIALALLIIWGINWNRFKRYCLND